MPKYLKRVYLLLLGQFSSFWKSEHFILGKILSFLLPNYKPDFNILAWIYTYNLKPQSINLRIDSSHIRWAYKRLHNL